MRLVAQGNRPVQRLENTKNEELSEIVIQPGHDPPRDISAESAGHPFRLVDGLQAENAP